MFPTPINRMKRFLVVLVLVLGLSLCLPLLGLNATLARPPAQVVTVIPSPVVTVTVTLPATATLTVTPTLTLTPPATLTLTPTATTPLTPTTLATLTPTLTPTPIVTLTATPTPLPTPVLPGPPARLHLGVADNLEPAPAGAAGQRWLAVYVTDADGLAVADGTLVTLNLVGGDLSQSLLQTSNGLVSTAFEVPPDQSFTLTALAGAVQGTFQGSGSDPTPPVALVENVGQPAYGPQALAIVRARNTIAVNGVAVVAENHTRRVDFGATGLTYQLKTQASPLPPQEQLSLGFVLDEIRSGSTTLSSGSLEQGVSHNWVTYQSEAERWQMLYQVGEAAVEQYFVFEKGTPTDQDLVITGTFQTQLEATLLSDEAGLRFVPPSSQG